jgi:hypothetical protein
MPAGRSPEQHGAQSCQPWPFRSVTTIAGDVAAAPDLVDTDFTAVELGNELVGDVTYTSTREGWLCWRPCWTVLEEVVGYAMADHMATDLVTDALPMAAFLVAARH